jgi:hypothetical protein
VLSSSATAWGGVRDSDVMRSWLKRVLDRQADRSEGVTAPARRIVI